MIAQYSIRLHLFNHFHNNNMMKCSTGKERGNKLIARSQKKTFSYNFIMIYFADAAADRSCMCLTIHAHGILIHIHGLPKRSLRLSVRFHINDLEVLYKI